MTVPRLVLNGAASFVLAAATIITVPSFAQNEFSRKSTPAERAQTQDLNRKATDGIVVRPTPGERDAYQSARSDYEAAQARYEAQLEEYNAKNRAYEEQLRNYGDEARANEERNDAYDQERADYDDEVGDAVVVTNDTYDPFDRLWSLDRVADPNTQLYNLPVEDIDGFLTGHFRRVEIRSNGDRMVVITLNSLRTVAIPEDQIRFDPDRSVIVADYTSNELDVLPSG